MGKAYVDDMEDPSAFHIQIGPFHYYRRGCPGRRRHGRC
ncbi:MAG: GNAT family N-acetyltransferase [Ignavibacteriales bacterium]|nr:GNAT family N-acetyltransferase [Ignavibacteriales bacterium]